MNLNDTQQRMYFYLQKKARSKKEMSEHCGVSIKTIENNIPTLKSEIKENDEIILHVTQKNGTILYFLTKKGIPDTEPPPPKIWDFYADKKTPFMFVQMPETNWKKLIIIPISDIHYGLIHCDTQQLDEWISWIERNENVFVLGLGDYMEQSTKLSIADGVFHQDLTPQQQITNLVKKLRPIANRFLYMSRGNHEKRSTIMGLDICEILANRLEIPYRQMTCDLVLNWKGNQWTFYTAHGFSSARTEGGKLNNVTNVAKDLDYRHFIVSGHVHDKTVRQRNIRVLDLENMRTELRKSYICISGSMVDYFGTYAEETLRSPGVKGWVKIELYEDGDYHASA